MSATDDRPQRFGEDYILGDPVTHLSASLRELAQPVRYATSERSGALTSDVLAQLDAAINGTCPCGASPREGSIYCGPDCEPTHISTHTDQRESGDYATPMRWRPDLVTEADDDDLLPLGSTTFYEGRYHAQLFERRGQDVWHLRLDDGCRYVGADLNDVGARIDDDLIRRVGEKWAALERELGNTRHLVADDPWADVFGVALRHTVSVNASVLVAPVGSDPNDLSGWRELGYTSDSPAVVQAPLLSDEQREHLEDAQRTMDEIMEPHWAALRAYAGDLTPVFNGMIAAHDQVRAAGVIPEQPPTDAEWALWLRRRRNTGPAAQPLDPRRRHRR